MGNLKLSLTDMDSNTLKSAFRQKALEIQKIGQLLGHRIFPYFNPGLPFFSALALPRQAEVVGRLDNLIEIYSSATSEDAEFDCRHLIWMAMRKFNLKPPSDFFDKISNEDVVQIFDDQGVQLFSNLKFFDLCSYSLEEVCCLDWTVLWERDMAVLVRLQELMIKTLTSPEIQSTVVVENFEHRVKEIQSPLMFELSYGMKAVAPLRSRETNAKAAFAVIEHGTILNELSPMEEESRLLEHTKTQEMSFRQI